MDISYTILGSDGNQYGPVALEQLKSWLAEGRVNADTQILRSDLNVWHPASQYTELAENLAPATTAPAGAAPRASGLTLATPVHAPSPAATGAIASSATAAGSAGPAYASPSQMAANAAEFAELEKRIKGGASWFYWIAGLTVVNTVVIQTGSGMSFVLGLTGSQFIDFFAIGSGQPALRVVALILDILAIGAFITFGVFANKKHLWAFAVGIGLYTIDTILTLFTGMWLGVAIHAFALFSLFIGLKSTLRWRALSK